MLMYLKYKILNYKGEVEGEVEALKQAFALAIGVDDLKDNDKLNWKNRIPFKVYKNYFTNVMREGTTE